MMTKGKSQGKALMKQSTIIPLAALVVMLFGGRTPANSGVFSSDTHNTQSLEQIAQNAPEGTTGATQAQLEEYEQFVRRGVHTEERDGKKTTVFYSPKYSEGDLKRMGELYLIMTPEQRSRQLLHVYLSEPWKIVHPSREEFESWKDEKEHGIWLDGVRIANSELSKYSPGDIGRWFTSRLTRTAKNYGKHVYQTNIYTVEYVEKFNERLPEYSIYPYPKRP